MAVSTLLIDVDQHLERYLWPYDAQIALEGELTLGTFELSGPDGIGP